MPHACTCCAAEVHCNGALPLFFSGWKIFYLHKPKEIHVHFIVFGDSIITKANVIMTEGKSK